MSEIGFTEAMEAGEDPFIKHSALIWRQDGCTVDQARFKAWCEGPDGYARRLERNAPLYVIED